MGADGADDTTILRNSARLYGSYGLKRVYYSAFSPIPDASATLPLKAPPLLREHRLYQADWLLRFYDFQAEELESATTGGMLDLAVDPKLAWALANRARFPVDLNAAAKEDLLRIPGVGTKTVEKLLALRRHRSVRYDDLARMGANMRSAEPFVVARDWTPRGLTDAAALRAPLRAAARAADPSFDWTRGRPRLAGRGAAGNGGRRKGPLVIHTVALPRIGTWDAWRTAARDLVRAGVDPADVQWSHGSPDATLFAAAPPEASRDAPAPTAPRAFVELSRLCAHHSDPERFALLHALLVRLQAERGLMEVVTDPLVSRLGRIAKAIRRDVHKTHAFVRFREIDARTPDAPPGGAPAPEPGPHHARRRFGAWFEPEHPTLELSASHFARRFTDMDWTIATPDLAAVFEGGTLRLAEDGPHAPPPEDATQALWNTYYSSIFNPARLKVHAMRAEMPRKYWRNLPEARLIPDLIATAGARVAEMRERMPTEPPRPRRAHRGAGQEGARHGPLRTQLRRRPARRRARLHPLPAARERDPGRLRRGAGRRRPHVRGRAAGRQRGPRRQALHRPRRDASSTRSPGVPGWTAPRPTSPTP